MSHTYKDQLRYKNKHRDWSDWDSVPYSETYICMTGTRRKKHYARQMNRKLRHDWKQGLYKDDFESLPRKHENIDWMVW